MFDNPMGKKVTTAHYLHVPYFCLSGIEKECRVIRDFYWKDPITKMFENRVLMALSKAPSHQRGEEPMPPYIHILTPANFFQNE